MSLFQDGSICARFRIYKYLGPFYRIKIFVTVLWMEVFMPVLDYKDIWARFRMKPYDLSCPFYETNIYHCFRVEVIVPVLEYKNIWARFRRKL